MSDQVVGTGGAVGNSAAVLASAAPPVRKKRNGKKSNGNGAAADANSRTIAITLPKDVLEWFELAASQAPFEPSVQRYISWELRQLAKNRQNAAKLSEVEDENDQAIAISESRRDGLAGL